MESGNLQNLVKELLSEKRFADMTIICGEREFKAHRIIVCPQSAFFNAAVNGNFKESSDQTVTLSDDDPDTIDRLLSFCYLHEYDVGDSTRLEPDEIARRHVRVYLAGDKFGIQPLRDHAAANVIDCVRSNRRWNGLPQLIQETLCCALPHDNGLREEIADILANDVQHLLTMLNSNQEEGRNVLVEDPELAVAILRLVVDKNAELGEQNDSLRKRIRYFQPSISFH